MIPRSKMVPFRRWRAHILLLLLAVASVQAFHLECVSRTTGVRGASTRSGRTTRVSARRSRRQPPIISEDWISSMPEKKVFKESPLPPSVGGSLLEGRWDVTLSNDVRIKNPLTVEIHGDKSFRLLERRRGFAYSLRLRRAGRFEFQAIGGQPEGDEAAAEGQLVLYPESQHLESLAGISLPVPDNHGVDAAVPDDAMVDTESVKTKNVRIFIEDRDTIMLAFRDTKKFYVLQRSSTVGDDTQHQSTPIYAILTTNVLGWVVSNVLTALGNDMSHMTHLIHF